MTMRDARCLVYNTFMRFFVSEPIMADKEYAVTDPGICRQAAKVLRKKTGDKIVLLDGSGKECVALIKEVKKDALVCAVLSCADNANEPHAPVALYQSVLKKDKMEWVFEKGTEVGVTGFVPVISEHSVKLGVNTVRARTIAREAAEQSHRGKIPTIGETMSFDDALRAAAASGRLNIIAHNIGEHRHIRDCCDAAEAGNGINVFIGPEGGFSEDEIARAESSGFRVVSLGRRVLRAETAAIVACFSLVS